MNEETRLIEEQKKTLPPNLVMAIESVPWKPLVQDIGKANMLDPNQIAVLERETMFIIYGFENPLDYSKNLERELSINDQISEQIFNAVWERVMDPINYKADQPVINYSEMKPEIPHDIHPVIEPGEVVHDAPHMETPAPIPTPQPVPITPPAPVPPPTQPQVTPHPSTPPTPQPAAQPAAPQPPVTPKVEPTPLPDYRYPSGQDPYREPLV